MRQARRRLSPGCGGGLSDAYCEVAKNSREHTGWWWWGAASFHLHIIDLRPLMRAVSSRCDATASFHIGPPIVGLGARRAGLAA